MSVGLARARREHVWLALPLAAVWVLAASVPITHADLFHMLLNGRLMAECGVFPVREDPFTFAPQEAPFFNQPWLAQLLYWAAYRAGGFAGISFFHAATLSTAFALLLWLLRREGATAGRAAGLLGLALALASADFTIRPQALATLPFAASLLLLRQAPPGAAWTYLALLAVQAGWSSLHGSFFFGPLLAGAHLVGAFIEERSPTAPRVRHHALLLAASLFGTLLTPAGPNVWLAAWRASAHPSNAFIPEWRSLSFTTFGGLLAAGSFVLVAALLVVRRRWPRPSDLLVLGGMAAAASASSRAIIWWGLAATPVLARHLAGWPASPRPPARKEGGAERPALNALVLALLAGLCLVSLPAWRPWSPLLPPALRSYLSPDHPVEALTFLADRSDARRVFSRAEWGGYVAWRLWPRGQPFLDSRNQLHPFQSWQEYFTILRAQSGWDSLLDAHGADALLLERRVHTVLIAAADGHAAWRRVYEDDLSVVFLRAR